MVQRWNIDGRTCAGWLSCLLLGAALTGCGSARSGAPSAPEVSGAPEGADSPGTADVPGTPGSTGTQQISDPQPVASQTCDGMLQFVPLVALPDAPGYYGPLPRSGPSWQALDPSSQRVLWSIEHINGLENRAFRWSKERGLSELARDARDSMWDPPEEVPYLKVTWGSADGRVGVGVSTGDTGFVWLETGEVRRLDLVPEAISRDGTVIIGWKGGKLARWTLASGVELPGLPPLGPVLLSASGDVIVGDDTDGNCHRWTEGTGDELLGLLPGATKCHAVLMNETGDVVVGAQQTVPSSRTRLFRWTRLTGLQDPALGDGVTSFPRAMSADGGLIAADVAGADGINPRFARWTASSGAVEIEQDTSLYPWFVSPPGDAVLGSISGTAIKQVGEASFTETFRWTEANGTQRLPISPQGLALGGKLVVGIGYDGPEILRFGDLGAGSRLIDRLPSSIVPEGWSEAALVGISEDGGLLIGSALDPDGERQLWLQHLACP